MDLKFKKFQQGGAMEQEPATSEPATAEPAQAQQDPIMQLAQMAMQALQGGDCNMAMQVCQGFVQLIQSSQNGEAAQTAPTEPVYRKGGVLVRRIRK